MAALTLEELPACPVETTLSFIGNKWQVLILRDLTLNGTMRFKEMQASVTRNVPAAQSVSTPMEKGLRKMEDAGLVHREVFPEVPPRVEYSLTDVGATLKPVLDALWAWGEGYKNALRLAEEAAKGA